MINLSVNQRGLLLLAIGLATTYLLVPFTEGSVLNIVQKSSACGLLALLAFSAVENSKIKKLLVIALLLSSLGDAFLAIRSSDYFTHGLASFLIAHLLYILIFIRAKNTQKPTPPMRISVAVIAVFALGMLTLIWPSLGALKAPVFIYVTVISLMAAAAIYSRYPAILAVTGALSFLLSDSAIALNKFLVPFPGSGSFIWITYILAQVLLALAIIRGTDKKNAGI